MAFPESKPDGKKEHENLDILQEIMVWLIEKNCDLIKPYAYVWAWIVSGFGLPDPLLYEI